MSPFTQMQALQNNLKMHGIDSSPLANLALKTIDTNNRATGCVTSLLRPSSELSSHLSCQLSMTKPRGNCRKCLKKWRPKRVFWPASQHHLASSTHLASAPPQ